MNCIQYLQLEICKVQNLYGAACCRRTGFPAPASAMRTWRQLRLRKGYTCAECCIILAEIKAQHQLPHRPGRLHHLPSPVSGQEVEIDHKPLVRWASGTPPNSHNNYLWVENPLTFNRTLILHSWSIVQPRYPENAENEHVTLKINS